MKLLIATDHAQSSYLIDLLVIYLVDADDVRVTTQEGRETDDRLRE